MNSSNQKQLYRGKPSKLAIALEAKSAYDSAVYVKPASQGSRKAFYQKLAEVADKNDTGNQSEALEIMSDLAIDLILITACDENGVPWFNTNDKSFLTDDLDSVYFDNLVEAGADILGLPGELKSGLMMDMDKEDKTEAEKKPVLEAVVLNQVIPENPQE